MIKIWQFEFFFLPNMVNWPIVYMVKIIFQIKIWWNLAKNENIGHFFQLFQFNFRVVQGSWKWGCAMGGKRKTIRFWGGNGHVNWCLRKFLDSSLCLLRKMLDGDRIKLMCTWVCKLLIWEGTTWNHAYNKRKGASALLYFTSGD